MAMNPSRVHPIIKYIDSVELRFVKNSPIVPDKIKKNNLKAGISVRENFSTIIFQMPVNLYFQI
jgi:hypothetical protein